MAIRSRNRRPVRIPQISTAKAQSKDFSFKKGLNTNLSNDDVPSDQWRYITDARETQVGKWDTKKGADLFSIPIGEAVNVQETSTTGASTFSFSSSIRWAQRLEATSSGRLTAIEANIENDDDATGTIVLALHADDAGEVGDEIMRTTVANSSVTGTAAYVKGRSITCPTITSGTFYWVIGYVQDGGSSTYKITTTTNASTGDTSTDSGSSWTDQAYAFNVKLSTATATGSKGHTRVKSSVGVSYTFMAHASTLYSVDEGTGVTTAIDTGLEAATTHVRFAFVNDTLYYVTGLQKPRKHVLGSGTASEVTTAPEYASDVMEHKGVLFYVSAVDPTKVFYSNFADYDTFTSTDFIYVPAPKTSDHIKSMRKLNGILYFTTRNNKHALYGSENATFRLDEAIGQKGTFSAESVASDENFMFLASDDGIFQFNGAEEKNIAEDVLDWWTGLLTRDTVVLELFNNRLYIFFTPDGEAINTRCKVYNYLYGIWESEDTNMYVGRAFARQDNDNYFILGSNRVGMLMLSEQTTNDYNNMGEPFTWELRTAYAHFDTPAQFKRAPVYRPHFDAVSSNYSVQVGYATDYNEAATYDDVALQGSGPRFDTGEEWDSGIVFGGTQQINPMDDGPVIPGEWRRLQLRYKHNAAREPIAFDGHVLGLQTQRMI